MFSFLVESKGAENGVTFFVENIALGTLIKSHQWAYYTRS